MSLLGSYRLFAGKARTRRDSPVLARRTVGPSRTGNHRERQGTTARGQDRYTGGWQARRHHHGRSQPENHPVPSQRRESPLLDRYQERGNSGRRHDGGREVPAAGRGVHVPGRGGDHRPIRRVAVRLRVVVPDPQGCRATGDRAVVSRLRVPVALSIMSRRVAAIGPLPGM